MTGSGINKKFTLAICENPKIARFVEQHLTEYDPDCLPVVAFVGLPHFLHEDVIQPGEFSECITPKRAQTVLRRSQNRSGSLSRQDIDALLERADAIKLFFERDRIGLYKAMCFEQDYLMESPKPSWLYGLANFSKDEMTHAFIPEGFGDPEVIALIEMSRRKYWFDYNWRRNSVAAFSELGFAPSKYELMTLFLLRRTKEALDDGKLCALMDRNGIGSPISMIAIIENLVRSKLVKYSMVSGYYLTQAGLCFIDKVHPQLDDSKLPARLQEWMLSSRDSRPEMAEYLRRLFSAQYRKGSMAVSNPAQP